MTYDFNLDNDLDIKPIAKNEQHFKKWSSSYPFYENVNKERVILYGAAQQRSWIRRGFISAMEDIRHSSDYDDFYIADKKETERQINVAKEFIDEVEKYFRDKQIRGQVD